MLLMGKTLNLAYEDNLVDDFLFSEQLEEFVNYPYVKNDET